MNFAMLGVGGFVAPRHLTAIADTGNTLLVACDPFDSVGILDRHFPGAHFFTDPTAFEGFVAAQQKKSAEEQIQFFSVCSPNHLHRPHVEMALRHGAHAICEKPLSLEPSDLDALMELEAQSEGRVHTVLQVRLMPSLLALRERLSKGSERASVTLSYITRRGRWYHTSWKGQEALSGGLVTNIGIHLFDLLLWLFGPAEQVTVHKREAERAAGYLQLQGADVRWFLSIAAEDLPESSVLAGDHALRALDVDGEDINFTTGFTGLHTELYRLALRNRGYGIEDARPAVELAHQIRHTALRPEQGEKHPLLVPRS